MARTTPMDAAKKKIAALEKEIEKMRENIIAPLDKKDLTKKGFGVIIEDNGKQYVIYDILFNEETGQAEVVGKRDLADSSFRADFEIKKMLAHGGIYNNE